jgi:hypothetical protein
MEEIQDIFHTQLGCNLLNDRRHVGGKFVCNTDKGKFFIKVKIN